MAVINIKPMVSTINTSRAPASVVTRIRGWGLTKIRKRIMLRDGYTCQVCGRATVDGQVDHKTPICVGGQETDANRWYLCAECHVVKSQEEERERRG